ncbi:hypothetical protein [Chitinophaga pinensis]|uniref:Lipoprotein n=1 Tax=Chitinophaga pinensis TaxID=79329 RepID=A0A5C6LQJ7_9BACT|nr:hypothetical protein [Chitinophaga pinensis]TWV99141.1 hypothetical protein FEF09_17875 [Chitinophaga pinensis]
MSKPIIAFTLLSALLFSCQQQAAQPEKKKFHLPFVLQDSSQEKAVLTEVKSVNPTNFPFLGKYKFCDTLRLADESNEKTTAGENYIIYEKGSIGTWDSLNTDGFQIFADYKTTIRYRTNPYDQTHLYFPVYMVNETDTTKFFFGKDRHAWGVQEAKDTADYASWYAIECPTFDFCGNGSFGVKVQPGEFIVLLVPRYKGSQTGSMRVRLQVDNTTYVSLRYEGEYHQEQFRFDMSRPTRFPAKFADSYINFGIYGAAFKRFR